MLEVKWQKSLGWKDVEVLEWSDRRAPSPRAPSAVQLSRFGSWRQLEKRLSDMLGFLRMPRPILYVPLMLLLFVACANAQTECRPSQEPGFMVSWANEPATPDHSEIQSLSKGTKLVCTAVAESGTPACRVKLQKDGEYSLPPHNAVRIPKDDLVSLTCGGSGMRCCKVQVTPDSGPLKKEDTKPHPQNG